MRDGSACSGSSVMSPNADRSFRMCGRVTGSEWRLGKGTNGGTGLYGMKGGVEPGGLDMISMTSASGMLCCNAPGTEFGLAGGLRGGTARSGCKNETFQSWSVKSLSSMLCPSRGLHTCMLPGL